MDTEQQRFLEMKRRVYKIVLPVLAASLGLSLFLSENEGLLLTINLMLLVGMLFAWLVLSTKLPLRVIEWFMLPLAGIYLLTMVIQGVYTQMLEYGDSSLGDFIIWMPLISLLMFLLFDRIPALIANLVLFGVLLIPSIPAFPRLQSEQVESLILFYAGMAVYTSLAYFLHQLYRRRAEQNAMLRFAYIDALTGIANRHRIDNWLRKKVELGEQTGKLFSVLFFDLDHFKDINDIYGHKTGDDVLRQLAVVVQKELDHGDLFGRWGGEEFIILTDTGEPESFRLAERLRRVVEDHDFGIAGRVTASFGLSVNRPGDTAESVVLRADERMYQSKQAGRNRVTGRTMVSGED
ncbi:GGDEF domain-containing protein [Bhargavaea massiliensis]|uniref:GGDEF domain-containing protein n=1 Tax=Bhargavaea massiliensis TaxID=2697500 RepID=UPI001BCF9590|nr:GGDEF domain-containing protein [Bhargavaea massiliensis]